MYGKSGRDIMLRVSYGELQVLLVAEGVSWSPDVANDMIARIRPLWRDALTDFKELGYLEDYDEDDIEYEYVDDEGAGEE